MSDGPLEVTSSSQNVELSGREVAEQRVEIPVAADLLCRTNEMGEALRALIVAAKRLPRNVAMESHQDPTRALAQAQVYLQVGFMWLRKAINQPKEF